MLTFLSGFSSRDQVGERFVDPDRTELRVLNDSFAMRVGRIDERCHGAQE
jgi:hypothetical protein